MKIDGLINLTSQGVAAETTGARAASEARRPAGASSANTSRQAEDTSKYSLSASKEEAQPTNLNSTVDEMNAEFAARNSTIRFRVDQESKDVIVSVVDKTSDEVIREIPPEEVVRMRERLKEMAGLLLEETA
jgi:flagellar protein FlaG